MDKSDFSAKTGTMTANMLDLVLISTTPQVFDLIEKLIKAVL